MREILRRYYAVTKPQAVSNWLLAIGQRYLIFDNLDLRVVMTRRAEAPELAEARYAAERLARREAARDSLSRSESGPNVATFFRQQGSINPALECKSFFINDLCRPVRGQ